MENKIGKLGRTDVNGDTTNGWKEDLDVRSSDELWTHSSCILEESATKEGIGAVKGN